MMDLSTLIPLSLVEQVNLLVLKELNDHFHHTVHIPLSNSSLH